MSSKVLKEWAWNQLEGRVEMEKTLEQRMSELEAEVAKGKEPKKQAFKLDKPWVPYDPTARMGMPASPYEPWLRLSQTFEA
jgi:hypothetical protein